MKRGKSTEAGPSSSEKQENMKMSENPEMLTPHDDDDDADDGITGFVPGPLVPLKEQIEKDKDDESLRRWKEKLLGCVEGDFSGQMEPEVKFHSISIISNDFGEIVTPLPVNENQNGKAMFTLREGSEYRLKLTFTVLHNIVSGLTYINTVWKGGLQVDQSKGMLGTFAPQKEPYIHTLEEETTPSGVLARGTYSAKLKFEDDDRRCHMELKYSFEIKRST
ncbi:Rho protein GDP-dissociation inhibitor [Dillenia turbinata]|uniref:Rho protein GDP-dissociation inhibitor n=1 Tax=Dillenia turbinata TaxID=194707 RepID=A0AAN8ZGV8_9MAGN